MYIWCLQIDFVRIEGINADQSLPTVHSWFPPVSIHKSNIVVREALVCAMYVEVHYYSSVLLHFPPVCYYYGIGEQALVDDEVNELKKCYAVVYPICFLCTSDGKHPHCKLPSNAVKKRKTS